MGIGLQVNERTAADPPSVSESDLGISAWAVRTARGPTSKAIRVTSRQQAKDRFFAEAQPSYESYYCIRSVFDNAGDYGAVVWIKRVIGEDAVAATLSVNDAATPTPDAAWKFTAGAYGEPEVGTWANNKLFVQVLAATSGDTNQRNISVLYQSDLDSAPLEVELWKNLALGNAAAQINHESRGSRWVVLTQLTLTLPVVQVAAVAISTGTPGVDGDVPAEADYNTARNFFNGLNVQIIVSCDLQTLTDTTNLETFCQNNGQVIGLFQAPKGVVDEDLDSYAITLKLKSFLMGIRGWITVDDEKSGTIAIPSVGAVIGAGFIRKTMDRGGYPHIAPAGPSASFIGITDLDDGTYNQDRLSQVNLSGFNPVVFQPGLGVFLKTSRTFSTSDQWYSAHIRVQMNYFKTSFYKSFSVIEQEGNNTTTRRRLRRSILRFMEKQYSNGGLNDAGGISNNLSVKCDTDNNPDSVVNARRLICDVIYRPVEIAENVVINLVRTTEGLAAQEL